MRVLISTPLFPPEINYPANFAKSFAQNLQTNNHDVTVLAFVNYPESIEGVKIVSVNKNQNIFKRLFIFTNKLFKEVKYHDVVVLKQAGISSLLTALVAKVFGKKIVLKLKEDEARERVEKQHVAKSSFLISRVKFLQSLVFKLADIIVFDSETLKENILSQYKINSSKIKILKHPEQRLYLPYENNSKQAEIEEWKTYIGEFENIVKNLHAK